MPPSSREYYAECTRVPWNYSGVSPTPRVHDVQCSGAGSLPRDQSRHCRWSLVTPSNFFPMSIFHDRGRPRPRPGGRLEISDFPENVSVAGWALTRSNTQSCGEKILGKERVRIVCPRRRALRRLRSFAAGTAQPELRTQLGELSSGVSSELSCPPPVAPRGRQRLVLLDHAKRAKHASSAPHPACDQQQAQGMRDAPSAGQLRR